MIKVTVTLEAIIDPDELGSAYTNEDLLLDEVKEHIQYGQLKVTGRLIVMPAVVNVYEPLVAANVMPLAPELIVCVAAKVTSP